MRYRPSLLLPVLALAACSGQPIGPATIPAARMDYNQAISHSWDEQLLLNLVRLRYLESPLFLDINGITASYSAGRSGSLSLKLPDSGRGELGTSLGGDFRDSPVISYVPLQGQAFARRLLAPLSLDALAALLRAGWSADLLLQCCVQTFGPLHNDPVQGVMFRRAAAALAAIQRARQLRVITGAQGLALDFGPPSAARDELQALLGQAAHSGPLQVVDAELPPGAALSVQTRSLLAVLYVQALGVEVPPGDEPRVAPLAGPDGRPLDLALLDRPLRIHQGAVAADSALVSVTLRGRSFWIDDSDLSSKQMLALLRMLLSLTAADLPAGTPLLSIPAR